MLRPSSRRGLTYADAVALLGAGESKFLSYVGRLAGVPASAAALATLSSVDLLAARNEILDWGQSAVRSITERRAGLSRFDRTERLTAAHTVLVVSAFFESWDSHGITLGEQAALGAWSTSESTVAGVAEVLGKASVPMPSAAVPWEALRSELEAYYSMLIEASARFLDGLAGTSADLDISVEAAIRRYEIGYRSLAADVPEFAIWAAMTDTAAGRATTERVGGEIATGLAGIRSMLEGLTGAAEECRADLADQYRRELAHPIVDVGDLPDGVTLPATADLYVNPRARARRAEQSAPVAAESWWEEAAAVPDIQSFLAGCLTGSDAVTAPLVVLGQPGSGKSMLTRVLAAALPPAEFLAVRVELRSVAADAPIQDQIEAAVYDTIGERVSWPELVRSAGGALPVVLLDGFDELLQASGANRADYLEQVRDFQRREADRGRPVAVLVTSRIVVADRARVPDGSVVLRLEPFDDQQIETWLAVWQAANNGSCCSSCSWRRTPRTKPGTCPCPTAPPCAPSTPAVGRPWSCACSRTTLAGSTPGSRSTCCWRRCSRRIGRSAATGLIRPTGRPGFWPPVTSATVTRS
ncbi:NACHT domain-containing protein [Paractinoplanes lichenicola]|uniref:ATP-binding protein n=1 Tax=Paractinoplanes lichenicola TaxID=2802976 RepID=A0ABS1VSG7_9ACTN|nr:ATP-binding protein [Actinoplanes lichenicola]MBL7256962.1 ATP-binding protein [Actinoplanes lichenicola]